MPFSAIAMFPSAALLQKLHNSFTTGHVLRSRPFAVQAPYDMAHSQAIGHAALKQYSDYKLDHLSPYFPSISGKPAIIPESKSFKEFVLEMKRVLDRQQLPERAFDWIFSPHQILNKPHPNCGGMSCTSTLQQQCHTSRTCEATQIQVLAGSWFEFGVWEGATLNGVAEYRRVNCDGQMGPDNKVYGFDTFTGLPEAWGEFRPSVRASSTCFALKLSHLHQAAYAIETDPGTVSWVVPVSVQLKEFVFSWFLKWFFSRQQHGCLAS